MIENAILKKEDLKIGMHVNPRMLSNVFGVYVFIDAYDNRELDGNILYFCDDIDSEDAEEKIKDIEKTHGGTCVFYLPKSYGEEDFAIYE
jgi:hypothetical protein